MFDEVSHRETPLSMESYTTSLARIMQEAAPQNTVSISLKNAVGHILAEDLTAPISVPSFDNSAMDGFAFRAACVENASSGRPVVLTVVGASIAGDTAGVSHLQPGFAAKIMTGAPLPEGADTILPVERASWDHEKLTFYEAYPLGKHVRLVGQDVEEDTVVLKAGTQLIGQYIPLLCALGLGHILVYQQPRISWITTGQEISDGFNQPLAPGHIYNATGLYGKSFLNNMNLSLDSSVTVRDTPQDFAGALEAALSGSATVIISTGGVSAGQYDFVRPVLEDFGAEILVHKARIKPGKPILFAKLPGDKFFFGLPGNPISTALGLRAFVYPFIRSLLGLLPEETRTARLSGSISTSLDRTEFLMANVKEDEQGTLKIVPQKMQQSFQTLPFSKSNAWLISPAGNTENTEGDIVNWIPMQPMHF